MYNNNYHHYYHLLCVQEMYIKTFLFFVSGLIKHIDFAFAHCVLLAARRDYSTDFISGTVIRKICTIYYDT